MYPIPPSQSDPSGMTSIWSVHQVHEARRDGVDAGSLILLQTYLGLGWVLGCVVFGSVVVQNSTDCRIGRQYLCQASALLCGVTILGCTAVKGYGGYVLFVWVYGLFCGAYNYSLKMFSYEKVRARNFASTWGFIQCSQAIPIALGVPIAGEEDAGRKMAMHVGIVLGGFAKSSRKF